MSYRTSGSSKSGNIKHTITIHSQIIQHFYRYLFSDPNNYLNAVWNVEHILDILGNMENILELYGIWNIS